jgi:hypothetical protein
MPSRASHIERAVPPICVAGCSCAIVGQGAQIWSRCAANVILGQLRNAGRQVVVKGSSA